MCIHIIIQIVIQHSTHLNDKKNMMEASKHSNEMLQPMYVMYSSAGCKEEHGAVTKTWCMYIYQQVQHKLACMPF